MVVLVGAGPGEPGLITQAGAAWIAKADAILYDRLVNRGLLKLARPGAELVCVGKTPGREGYSQQQINDLMLAKCRAGKLVVRLKGGDPMMFGRGGEEAEAVAAASCGLRIVPGVTAAVAAAAAAGIPLTDRRNASTVAFASGREAAGKDGAGVDWRALAGMDTVVFYMAVGNLAEVADKLVRAGKDGDTPAAVVRGATTARQQTVVATLGTIAARGGEAGIQPPALLLVGPGVETRRRIAWMEKLPLFGRTVIVTRPEGQAQDLSRMLVEQGADVIEAPTITIEPPADYGPLDEALLGIRRYDWLVLTSVNGVAHVVGRLLQTGSDARALAGVKVAAAGPATAAALEARSIKADLLPAEFTSEALARELVARHAVSGKRILLARSSEATAMLPEILSSAGAAVDQVIAYRPAAVRALPAEALEALRSGQPVWITVTSANSVPRLQGMLRFSDVDLSGVKTAAVGPVTAERLRLSGLGPDVVACPHTTEALVEAIVEAELAARP